MHDWSSQKCSICSISLKKLVVKVTITVIRKEHRVKERITSKKSEDGQNGLQKYLHLSSS